MPPIFKWSCSYYRNKTKKWIYGNLYMYQETLKFIETNKNEEPLKVLIQLSSISEIKRVTSMIMYSCMVLNMGVGLPLWFSSFENRNRVIQTVEHFWREQLLGKSDTERYVKSFISGIGILQNCRSETFHKIRGLTLTIFVKELYHRQGFKYATENSQESTVYGFSF